jgi:hypothetical protein
VSHDKILPCTKLSAKRKTTDIADQCYACLPASSPPSEYAVCASPLVPSASNLCLPHLPDERDQASIISDACNNYIRTGIFSAAYIVDLLLSLYYKIIKSVSQNNLKARRTVYALQSCQIPSQPFLDTFSASAQCLLRQLRIIPSVQGLPSMFMKPTNLSIFSRSSAMRWTRLGKRISSFVPSYAISRNKAHTIADLTPQFRKFRIASYPACENRILDFTIHISMQG